MYIFNFTLSSDISHSALSDMETIQQSAAPKTQTKSSNFGNSDDLGDIDNVLSDYSSQLYIDNVGVRGNGGSKSSKLDKRELEMMGFEAIEPIAGGHSNITSMFAGGDGDAKQKPSAKTTSSRSSDSTAQKSANKSKSMTFDETSAQQKFGSAKGFGSDQFFANESSKSDRRKANLSRFQNSDSISSSEYFGRNEQGNGVRGQGSRDSTC